MKIIHTNVFCAEGKGCSPQLLEEIRTGSKGWHLSVLASIGGGCHYYHNLKRELNYLLHIVISCLYCNCFLTSPLMLLLWLLPASDLPCDTVLPFQESSGLPWKPGDIDLPFFGYLPLRSTPFSHNQAVVKHEIQVSTLLLLSKCKLWLHEYLRKSLVSCLPPKLSVGMIFLALCLVSKQCSPAVIG